MINKIRISEEALKDGMMDHMLWSKIKELLLEHREVEIVLISNEGE